MTEMHAMPAIVMRSGPPRRLSRIFADLAREAEDVVTVEQIRQALGDRSFATLLVFFACLNLLPFPPGSTLLLGIPLMLISLQMVRRDNTVWLPRFILRKSVGAEQFRLMTDRLVPRLEWIERMIRPRYWPFARAHADRLIGLAALVLATAVTLPIPLGNWLPAFSCVLLGLAHSERDGLLLTVAAGCGLLSLIIIAIVIGTAGAFAGFLFG